VDVNPQRIYVFRNLYVGAVVNRDEYSINNYKGYYPGNVPDIISAEEVDKWGVILSRKEKIEKIKESGSKKGHRRMDGYQI
jgi:hypothetical protein